MQITDEEIEKAKGKTKYRYLDDIVHEHNDCIRIAYEWLDAQKTLSNTSIDFHLELKHVIEAWGGRYVSENDVEVAATLLHPKIKGRYPKFNLSKKIILPRKSRLYGIKEAFTQPRYMSTNYKNYYCGIEDEI